MRRRSDAAAADPDSDLSISEDEDFDEGLSNYCVSLDGGGNALKQQEGIQVLLQLEKLRDGGVTTSVTKSNIQSKAGQAEDDADILRFGDHGQFTPSAKDSFPCSSGDEEIASDDEDEEYTGLISSINRGGCATSLRHKNEQEESASWELKEQISATCIKSKEKQTKSDDHQRDIDKQCWSPFSTDVCNASQKVQNLAEKPENFPAKNTEYPSADELEDFDEQHGNQPVSKQSNMTTFPGGHVKQSIAECLDDLQDKTSLPEGNPMVVFPPLNIGVHLQVVTFHHICHCYSASKPGKKRKKTSHGGDIEREAVDTKFLDEVLPDPIGSASGSSGEENNYDECKLPISHRDRSTMAERFQEILNSTSLANVDAFYSVQKPSSSGIFGQLQRVMQSQKDTDVEFLKMIQNEGCHDSGKISGDVLILSRQLDAKLTVCQCSLKGNQGNPLSFDGAEANSATRERTVIFSPRVCSGVDLEIGNLIRIYPPWLEVKVRGHNQNMMILCTYYSQLTA